jgi:putative hemolysin
MMTALIVEAIVLVLLLLCSAFFSSAETALFSLNPIQIHRIRRTRPKAANRIAAMLTTPARPLSTILIGNTVVNVAASGLGFVLASQLAPGYGKAIAIPVMIVLLLVFGEVTPKRFAMLNAERLACLYAPVLVGLMAATAPVRAGLEWLAARLGRHVHAPRRALSEDEFRTVVEVGREEGVLDEEEQDMVDGIIRLEEQQASDVMTPRVDFIGIDLEDSLARNIDVAKSVTFRFLPVYRGSPDHVEGFLDVPRFLLDGATDLQAALVDPFSVPETAPLDSLLATFQREHRRIAFVVDEFGGTAGLVTRGDILEEIVADVDNEYGDEALTIQRISDTTWLVDGSTSLEDVNDELDLRLEADGADRIAGWVSAQAERIPHAGDSVEAQGCRATVQRVRRNRILNVVLEKTAPPPKTANAEGLL